MQYTLTQIAQITQGTLIGTNRQIKKISFDSRTVIDGSITLFAAIKGTNFNGHNYITELYQRGVKAFIVQETPPEKPSDTAFILVKDTIAALQALAADHRSNFKKPVVAITGSNGKTIVKEWISQLATPEKHIFRSPGSYNSQLGVSLSLLMIPNNASIAVIEAGISKPGEMSRLEAIISPNIVIITNIGEAHSENFSSQAQKLQEKLMISKNAQKVIYPSSLSIITNTIPAEKQFSWGEEVGSTLLITSKSISKDATTINFTYQDINHTVTIPFTDAASADNVISALALYALLGYDLEEVCSRAVTLQSVAMRLELRTGIDNSIVVNDSYNSDLNSLEIALDYLASVAGKRRRCVILSDILQSGYSEKELYERVSELLRSKGVDHITGIGVAISKYRDAFSGIESLFYPSTDDFLRNFQRGELSGEAILLKGSRPFSFERIARTLEQKIHTTIMEVNLNAIGYNLDYYRSLLKPGVKTMAMVKALSYGSGSVEIALALQNRRIDYLAVAFADEGIALREGGITTPIVVLNSDPYSFDTMIEYSLEPEIYSFSSLKAFRRQVQHQGLSDYPIHIKLDTGMHRLGFIEEELPELIAQLRADNVVKARSIFSHFTSSDNPDHDNFTHEQINRYDRMSSKIKEALADSDIIRHLCNSSAIERFPEAQFDMVRLGLGLYGISPIGRNNLMPASSLRSVVVQLRKRCKGETIGYNRSETLTRDSVIATIAIGYADGLRRALSRGGWSMIIHGKAAPIVGNICMDTCMIDVTDIEGVREGDMVDVFGEKNSVESMAEVLHTIPYEVLTSVSTRIKRVYIKE